MNDEINNQESILKVGLFEQYQVVDKLLDESRSGSVYYTLLMVSSLIVTSGLLLGNGFLTIGGILIAPVLTPILVISLGLAVGELEPIKKVSLLLFKTFVIIIASSFILSLLIGSIQRTELFENTMRTAVLYFVVAVASGVGATFALVRKEVVQLVPGTAIAVSLMPPLSLIGIWLSSLNWEIARYFFLIFLFNVIGIMVGSLIVFSLLKFYKTEKEVQKKTNEIPQADNNN